MTGYESPHIESTESVEALMTFAQKWRPDRGGRRRTGGGQASSGHS